MGLVLKWYNGNTILAGCDIDNAFRELRKQGVLNAVKKAVSLVRKHRGMRRSLLFSIAKGGEHLVDRIGHASDNRYSDVSKFITWDMHLILIPVQTTREPREGRGYVAISPKFGFFLIFSMCRALRTPEKAGVL